MAKFNPLMLAPVVLFAGFVGLAYVGNSAGSDEAPPTGREGGPVPALIMETLGGEPTFDAEDLSAPGLKLVNFWASWCAPCRAEHPNLTLLAEEGLPIYGINYKDDPEKALAFLEELGNPYAGIGADPRARTALEWGVAGVPETYIIDSDGTIVLRFAGPITERVLKGRIRPVLESEE